VTATNFEQKENFARKEIEHEIPFKLMRRSREQSSGGKKKEGGQSFSI
jgi:hypothetical protein